MIGNCNAPGVIYPELKAVQDNINGAITSLRQDITELASAGMGYILKITFEEEFEGCNFTVTGGGETKTGTVGASHIASVSVSHPNTVYTIDVVRLGIHYRNGLMTGTYFGEYPVAMTLFAVTLNVTCNVPGATVTAAFADSCFAITDIANADGEATLPLNVVGNWTVSASMTQFGVICQSTNVV